MFQVGSWNRGRLKPKFFTYDEDLKMVRGTNANWEKEMESTEAKENRRLKYC